MDIQQLLRRHIKSSTALIHPLDSFWQLPKQRKPNTLCCLKRFWVLFLFCRSRLFRCLHCFLCCLFASLLQLTCWGLRVVVGRIGGRVPKVGAGGAVGLGDRVGCTCVPINTCKQSTLLSVMYNTAYGISRVVFIVVQSVHYWTTHQFFLLFH